MTEPWVEKYRPNEFDNIVLEKNNQHFFQEIMNQNYIPNMLFYGPPGTGKTTTILSLIQSYQKKNGGINHGLVIHLNASDERGVDTIRTQLYSFVHTKPFYVSGTKFVILDEVDSMTKNAQEALSCMLHTHIPVCFCLICNYISKIEDTLQSMFIKIKFNKLPRQKVIDFLTTIVDEEKLTYTKRQLECIQSMYGSDIRSMINYIQMNQDKPDEPIHYEVWDKLEEQLKECSIDDNTRYMYELSKKYNMDIKQLLKDFLYYLITKKEKQINLSNVEILFHTQSIQPDHMIKYLLYALN